MKNRDQRDEMALRADEDGHECEVSAEAMAQAFPIGDLLRQDMGAEIVRREGEWDAFTAGVSRRIASLLVSEGRMNAEERAVNQLREQVESEVHELAPRFEQEFGRGVEAKIFRAGRERRTFSDLFARLIESLGDAFELRKFAYAAPVTLLLTVGLWMKFDTSSNVLGDRSVRSGSVAVQSMSFEGTVTLMNEDDQTVLWLDEPTS